MKSFALRCGLCTSEIESIPRGLIDLAKHDPLPEILDDRVLAKQTYAADEVIELVP